MSSTMDLVVFTATGHVLSAAVRDQVAGGQPNISDFVGNGLWLRDPATGETLLVVDPELLSSTSVDRRDSVLLTARNFGVVDNLPEELGQLGANPVQLNGANLTVALPGNVSANTEVWLIIGGTSGQIVQKVQVPSGQASGIEPLTLQSGDYTVLMLAPGYRTTVVEEQVP